MFETEEAKRFFAAWQALRDGTEVPHFRTAFQRLPSEILPQLLVVERESEDLYTTRFAGTRVVEFWGEDMTGRNALDALPPRMAMAAKRNLFQVISHPCGIASLGVYPVTARGEVAMEYVFLPALNDPGKPPRILGFGQSLKPPLPMEDDRPGVARRRWIDLGFGVPAERPAS